MTKPRRFIAIADNHGDMIDPETEKALFSFISDFKPEIRVHLGDNFDFRPLRKGASPEDKSESMKADAEAGKDFLKRFFERKTENHFLRGNHDERLWSAREDASGPIRDHAIDCVKDITDTLANRQVHMLPYHVRDGILRLGSLKCLHGYAHGIHAAQLHARVYRNCIFGHIHSIVVSPVESDEGPMEARCIGAICKIDLGYNSTRTATLRQENGWAYGHLFADGSYQLFQTRKINGSFYAAHEIKAY